MIADGGRTNGHGRHFTTVDRCELSGHGGVLGAVAGGMPSAHRGSGEVVSEVGRTVISIYEETDKPHRYHRLPSDLGDRRSLTRAENSDLSVP